jgi:agmatinase
MGQDCAAVPTVTRAFDLWGVPFDGASTLGWPGSRYAPERVRTALGWMTMRAQDERIYSIDTGRLHHFEATLLRDRGDAGVVPHDLMASLQACSAAVSDSLGQGRVPVVIGGDDSLLYACVKGFHDGHEGRVAILHFDAHLDLLDESRRQGRFSQSSGMRRALELPRVSVKHSIQVGVRNFNFPASREFITNLGLAQLPAVEFHQLGTEAAVDQILQRLSGCDHVFWAFDIDVIDPSAAPGAGAHEPGGLTSRQVLDCVRRLAGHCDGLSIVEVNPLLDHHDMTSTLAANLAFAFAVFGQERADRDVPHT